MIDDLIKKGLRDERLEAAMRRHLTAEESPEFKSWIEHAIEQLPHNQKKLRER